MRHLKTSADKFVSYGVAVTACLATCGSTNAEVVTFDNGGAGWLGTSTSGPMLTLGLNGQVTTDGTLPLDYQLEFNRTSSPKNKIQILSGPSQPTGTPMATAGPLGGNQEISASSNTPGGPMILYTEASGSSWTLGQRGYVGLGLYDTAGVHYGWADITINNLDSFILFAYGYETLVNEPITTPPLVPEPATSTLMMVAGASGLLALRQRRKAQSR